MLLSIIIPVYNVEQYLHQCLDSVLQLYNAGCDRFGDYWMNLVCIDDGSTDSSLEILQGFKAHYSFVTIESVHNGGAGYARNIGIQNATGDFIYFLDSDDYILPDAFLDVLNSLNLDVDIACCNANYGENGPLIKSCSFSADSGGEFCEKLYNQANIYYPCQLWAYFYRRAFLKSNHIVFPEGIVCEDEEFTWTALSIAQKTIKKDNIIVYHRQNRIGSVMYDVSVRHINSLIQVSRHLFAHVEKRKDVCPALKHALYALYIQVLSLCKKQAISYNIIFCKEDKKALKYLANNIVERRTYALSLFSLNLALKYYTYEMWQLCRKIINSIFIIVENVSYTGHHK